MIVSLILMVIGAVCAAPAMAAGGVVGVPLKTCIAKAEPGMSPGERFSPGARYDCTTPQTKFGPGDYWVRSQPLAGLHGNSRIERVRIASLWQRAITLYVLYPDGRITRSRLDGPAASKHLQLGAIFEWSLPPELDADKSVQLLWHVEGSANLRGVVIAPTLAVPRQSTRANLSMGAMYAAFAGLCAALLIYNLAMWGALRYPFQLSYCAMVLALMLYAYTSSGALAWSIPDIANNDRLRLNYALLAFAAIAALNFARTFFERNVSAGWVGRSMTGVSVMMIGITAAFCILAPWKIRLLDTAYALSFIAMIAVVVPVVIRARAQRSPHLWLFALAWAAPVVFAVIRLIANLTLIQWNFWLDNSTILSMTSEAVMSSLAIAYRIRLLQIERDEARASEIAARMLADIDPLTGLLNRRAFLNQSIGSDSKQTLLVIDIDHFKRVNDTLGHDGGDEVLRVFARVLRQTAPDGALVARIGGEEFAILAPATSAIDADAILAKLRAARMPFDLTVTASIGSCSGMIGTERDWKAMYRTADRALYTAKTDGRDRARVAQSAASAA